MNQLSIIEKSLQSFDNFFKSKTKREKYMIYIMVAATTFTLANPLYDLSFNKFKLLRDEIGNLTTKIDANKFYLTINTEEKITKLDLEIKKIESELQASKEANRYIKKSIETISSLIYNEKTWGEYLSSISKNASRHDIKIINFTNKYIDNNNSFGHLLNITLEVSGSYFNTLNFINSLEQNELVVDIHDFSIKAQDKLYSRFDISVWGIK